MIRLVFSNVSRWQESPFHRLIITKEACA
jgi:hypothetical protein